MKLQSCCSDTLVTAGFYEPFTAAGAIKALSEVGFEDGDITMLGMLAGSLSNLTEVYEAIGLPLAHALYYQNSFEDGGLLLIVRARELEMKETALAVLNARGAHFPPAPVAH